MKVPPLVHVPRRERQGGLPRRRSLGRRGAVAMMFGLSAVALMLCIGLAVDAARLWLLRARLQSAVDAAVLQAVAANEDPSNNAKAVADASRLFWTNYGRTATTTTSTACPTANDTANTGFIGSVVCGSNLSVTFPDASHAQVQATALLDMTIMKLGGFNKLPVSASAYGQRAGGVEVALVLDVSLSMNFDTADGSGNNKLVALRAAAKNMLTALYGNGTSVPNLWLSLIPFAGVVNVGNSHTNWLDSTFTTGTFKGAVGTDGTGAGWRGCVEARQNGYDMTEDSPGTARFAPFYWPTTLGKYLQPNGTPYAVGDNDWSPGNITETDTAPQTGYNTAILKGPNLGCPQSPLVPPTLSRTTISNAIDSLKPVGPIGTVVVQGLQWGWFAVSPSWQGSGGWNLTNSAGSAVPLPYASPNNQKVIVLMTDGTNDVSGAQTWYGQQNPPPNQVFNDGRCIGTMAPSCLPTASDGATNAPKSAAWAGRDADTWYSPYGRASAGRIPSVPPPPYTGPGNQAHNSELAVRAFSRALDTKFGDLCTAIKAKGVIIYTIFFHGPTDDSADWFLGADIGTPGAKQLLQNCATDIGHFYDANNAASINTAFVTIAQQISAMRIQK